MSERRSKQTVPQAFEPSVEARLALGRVGGYAELFDAVALCCRQIIGKDFVECALGLTDPENPDFFYPLRSHLPMRPPMKERCDAESDILALGLASNEALVLYDRAVEARPIARPLSGHGAPAARAAAAPARRELPPLPPWITAPLLHQREKVGVLAVRIRPWGGGGAPAYMLSLGRLANDIAWASALCHRNEQREQSLRDYHDIFRVSAHLQTIRDLNELLAEACDCFIRAFGFDRAAILLLLDEEEDGGQNLRWAASQGYEDRPSDCGHLIPARGAIADVMKDNAPRVILSPRDDLSAPVFMRECAEISRAVILSLRSKSRPLGVICADHRFDRGQLGRRRMAALVLFANQVALAIDNVRLYSRVDILAKTDSLTSLFNRHYFDESLEREIARVKRYGQDLCLMMADLRDFKRFNDRFGHLVGDEMLRRVARILKDNVRASDIVCRFGGDEFVVLMPNTNLRQAEWVRSRIEQAMRNANEDASLDGQRIELSIGLRAAEPHKPEKILAEADTAMYEDKARQARQNVIRIFVAGPLSEIDRADPFIGNVLRVLREKEPFYIHHARRVMALALSIAQRLDLPACEIENICLGALLHDAGKVALSADLLQKPSSLTPSEYQVIRTHPVLGADLLGGIAYLEPIRPTVRHHHERYDGRTCGQFPAYPDGLTGEAIPLGARIVKVADCYDFLTSSRPYHLPLPSGEVIHILRDESGRSFDPRIVNVFLSYLEIIGAPLSPALPGERLREAALA